jgi:hypothetical protein
MDFQVFSLLSFGVDVCDLFSDGSVIAIILDHEGSLKVHCDGKPITQNLGYIMFYKLKC